MKTHHPSFATFVLTLWLSFGLPFPASPTAATLDSAPPIGADADANAALVGDRGDLSRLVFEGCKTFDAAKIKRSLAVSLDIQLAAHSLAPRDAYLRTLQTRIQAGYLRAGFAAARVTTALDPTAEKVLIHVDEGPRYLSRTIELVGAKTIPQDSFIRQLTDNLSPATNHLPTTSASPVSSPPPANPFAANMVANSSPSNPVVRLDLWFQGQPARFDRATLRFITEAVNNTLADLGYFFARVNVTVLPEPPRQTAILRVEILDEGSKAILDQIEIIGAEKNPREVILDFLGLKLGMAWNRDLLLERERLLWQSARFVSYKLSTLPPDSSGKQALRIELREMREAPPLSQALSRSEKTLLKFQDWMMSWPASQEDFVITLTQESPPGTNSRVLHAVLATNGMAMALSDIDPQAPQGIRLSYGLIASTNGDGLFALDQQRKLVSPPLNQNVIAFVNFLPNPDPTASNRFDLLMGGGREQHEPIVSNQIPARGRRVPQPGPSGTKRYHLRAGRHDHHA